jgi:uncharacterized membrane protein YedE/YeeE
VTRNRVGLLLGVAFGVVLGWARLTDYDVIHDMLLLREADVFLLMMAAIATAAIGIRALRWLGVMSVLDRTPVSWTVAASRRQHVIGSAVFGVGWSIAGTCPGPVAAQLGRGQLASLVTMTGLLLGIVVCDFARSRRPSPAYAAPFRDAANVAGL